MKENCVDVDPIEENRARREEISRKYGTMNAYVAYLQTLPPADVLLERLNAKIEAQGTKFAPPL
jgi:hypothetical protein